MTRPSSGIGIPSGEATSSEDRLSALLTARGAVPLGFALTRTLPPGDPAPLQEAVARVVDYDWVVVTSARSVPPLIEALRRAGVPASSVRSRGVRVCAVGPGTGESLAGAGLPPDLVPERYEAGGVVEALRRAGARRPVAAPGAPGGEPSRGELAGLRVLFPRAEEGRDLIPRELERLGARVDLVAAYRTVPDEDEARRLVRGVASGEVDAIAFTAGSAARSFAVGWGSGGPLPTGVGIVAIGPATAEALTVVGLPVHEVADPHTLEGLVGALERWAAGRRP